MPTINASLIPTKSPGTIFAAFTGGDESLTIRWITALDPVFYEVTNRPIADVVVRQLILAKAIDTVQLSLGKSNLYPFVVQPRVASGTDELDIPIGWIWDISMSLPMKWETLRLAKIKRISGSNGTGGYTGSLRFIFTANVQNSVTETAVLYADYEIGSDLTYQLVRMTVCDSSEESVSISAGESETVAGFIIFQTLDQTDADIQTLYEFLAPPSDTTDGNSDGYFDSPAVYEIVNSEAGSSAITDDFSTSVIVHGTGLLTDSAWNPIPQLDTDILSWIRSFNYPFDNTATLTSVDSIVIPTGLFKEFNICAPAGDEPTGDSSGTYYPVWINRIERVDTGGDRLRLYFATYNVVDAAIGGSPSTTAIEFATLDLYRSYTENEIVAIVPIDDLMGSSSSEDQQGFGRGHVVLSSLWNKISSDVDDFFDAFDVIVDSPADTEYTLSATRLSAFGISRVPKYTPTIGQSYALQGSTARLTTPVAPSDSNRYICEEDQGLGDQIDLESVSGITAHSSISRYAYSGSLAHRIIHLAVNYDLVDDSDTTFYDTYILPRMVALLGRAPKFGDFWFDGTRLLFNDGDTWVG